MPEIFYDMDLGDFMLMQKGFFARRKSDDLSFAKVAFYIAAIHQNIAGKPLHGKQFIMEWFGEKPQGLTKEELTERSRVVRQKLELMQKIEDEKRKHGRTTENNN
jgi:hypothetical protein